MFDNVTISNDVKIGDIHEFFDQNIPDKHPEYFWDSRLSNKSVFMAYDNQTPCGFLVINLIWGNTPFIELLKIKDDHQKIGIGKKLVGEATRIVKGWGFEQIVSSSESSNKDGITFHEKCGFTKLNSLDLPHGEEQFFIMNIKDFKDHA